MLQTKVVLEILKGIKAVKPSMFDTEHFEVLMADRALNEVGNRLTPAPFPAAIIFAWVAKTLSCGNLVETLSAWTGGKIHRSFSIPRSRFHSTLGITSLRRDTRMRHPGYSLRCLT